MIARVIVAVVFDMDGVLIQSEEVWDEVREAYVRELGGRYDAEVQRALMGMSSVEWSRYMHETLGVPMEPEEISALVAERLAERYRRDLPLLPHAVETVRELAGHLPLALASSANRPVIDLVLALTGLAPCFRVTVSSEEVSRGKPAPDVYLEAARRLDVDPTTAAGVEDSTNGLLSARAAGLAVIAIPNREFPPAPEGLAAADVVLGSLHELTPEAIEQVAA
jgi:HAD superfamily hydrolase (TIGR01509 family)